MRQGFLVVPHFFSLYTEDIMEQVEIDPRHEDFHEPSIQSL